MIGLIFSYAKSAAVFAVSVCACAAGITLVCLFTSDTFDLIMRLVGLAILLLALYAMSAAYAFSLLMKEIDRLGGDACDCQTLGARLQKIAHRILAGKLRGAVLLQYAYTQIYRGLYKEAMCTVSDAVIAGKEGIKGDAAVCFCQIFYALKDATYFANYYERADETLAKRADTKNARDRAQINARRAALAAMRLHLHGDAAGALARLRDFDTEGVPALQRKNLAALCDKIIEDSAG